jgi:hypothetical protein
MAITSLVIRQGFVFPRWFYLYLPPLTSHSSSANFILLSHAFVLFLPSRTNLFSSSIVAGLDMPRERGKPKRGPTYYSQASQHHRIGPMALQPSPQENLALPPFSDQNWAMETQAVPQLLILEPNYRSCIVEEENPSHWVDIPQHLQVVGDEMAM